MNRSFYPLLLVVAGAAACAVGVYLMAEDEEDLELERQLEETKRELERVVREARERLDTPLPGALGHLRPGGAL